MDDLRLLAAFASGESFAEALLRDTLDLTATRAAERTLACFRWHFLLGTLPTAAPTGRDIVSDCETAAVRIRTEWEAALAACGKAPDSAPGSNTRSPAPQAKRRVAKFDSSSSDSDEDEHTVGNGFRAKQRAGINASTNLDTGRGNDTVVSENPLRPQDNSLYALEFRVATIQREIDKDVSRLYWELPLFEDPRSKRDVANILLAFCITERREYKQGLHEVVAFLYHTAYRDRTLLPCEEALRCREELTSADPHEPFCGWLSLYCRMADPEAHAACTFALFRQLMSVEGSTAATDEAGFGLSLWYYTAKELGITRDPATNKLSNVSSEDRTTNGSRLLDEATGVVVAAERVQQDLLLTVDRRLQHRLDSDYGIHAVSYLIRWLRLLFLRELSFTQGLSVWSVLFAEMRLCQYRNKPFDLQTSLSLFLAVAMLLYIREDLLVDSTSALKRLMRFPPLEDGRLLLATAVTLSTNPLLHIYARTTGARAALPDDNADQAGGVPTTRDTRPPNGSVASSTTDVAAETLTRVMHRQGTCVNAALGKLEKYWLRQSAARGTTTASGESDIEAEFLEALAELKKVRDVLLFDLEE